MEFSVGTGPVRKQRPATRWVTAALALTAAVVTALLVIVFAAIGSTDRVDGNANAAPAPGPISGPAAGGTTIAALAAPPTAAWTVAPKDIRSEAADPRARSGMGILGYDGRGPLVGIGVNGTDVVAALDAATGKARWQTPLKAPKQCAAVPSGIACIGQESGQSALSFLSAENGQVGKSYPLQSDTASSVTAAGELLVAVNRTTIIAYRGNGDTAWTVKVPLEGVAAAPGLVAVSPAAQLVAVSMRGTGGFVYRLSDGEELVNGRETGHSALALFRAGYGIATDGNSKFFDRDGAPLASAAGWSPVPTPAESVCAKPVAVNKDNALAVVDPYTGKPLWQQTLGSPDAAQRVFCIGDKIAVSDGAKTNNFSVHTAVDGRKLSTVVLGPDDRILGSSGDIAYIAGRTALPRPRNSRAPLTFANTLVAVDLVKGASPWLVQSPDQYSVVGDRAYVAGPAAITQLK